jgi:ElaB/YqjD/DUF883 family membrane-anchored ribosome-binding protein
MANTSPEAQTIASLHEDISALKRDMAQLIDQLGQRGAAKVASASAEIESGARQAYSDAAATATRSAKAAMRQIEEQPLTALLIALGIGFIGGRLLSR